MVKGFSLSLTFLTNYPPCTFFAGEQLSAVFIVDVQGNDLKVKQITAEFLGIARCSWGSGNNKRFGRELFYRKQVQLNFGRFEDCGDFLLLSNGIHGFKLDCRLPKDLPSSLRVTRGYIFYEVWVTMGLLPPLTNSPLKFQEMTESFPFKVIGIFNISSGSCDHEEPVHLSDRIKLRSWSPSLTRCGQVNMSSVQWRIDLPRSGFSLGQQIPFTVEILNQSNKHLRHLLVQLMQEVRYTANDLPDQMSNVQKVCGLKIGLDRKGPCRLRVEDELEIPCFPMTTSTPGRCTVVRICYFVRFTLQLLMNRVVKVVPIIIGTF